MKTLSGQERNELLQSFCKHAGLFIIVNDGCTIVEGTVGFGGCPSCLASLISTKMIGDDNFATVIAAAMELYQEKLKDNW
jgi:hypothetical protein